jgi:hypothetical protein
MLLSELKIYFVVAILGDQSDSSDGTGSYQSMLYDASSSLFVQAHVLSRLSWAILDAGDLCKVLSDSRELFEDGVLFGLNIVKSQVR